MKVSEVQVSNIAEYLRLSTGEYTDAEIKTYMDAANAYIKSYTGLDAAEVDTHEDITIVLFVLCEDMYDTRTMYVERNYMNKVVETILGMYSTNLLPTPDEVET